MRVGLVETLVRLLIGVLWGATAGFIGGRVDAMMMRFVDILYSIPRLLIIMVAVYAFDRPLKEWFAANDWRMLVDFSRVVLLIVVLGLNAWLSLARIVRGQVLSLKEQQFVLAARALGHVDEQHQHAEPAPGAAEHVRRSHVSAADLSEIHAAAIAGDQETDRKRAQKVAEERRGHPLILLSTAKATGSLPAVASGWFMSAARDQAPRNRRRRAGLGCDTATRA